jgi:hypothetical protein
MPEELHTPAPLSSSGSGGRYDPNTFDYGKRLDQENIHPVLIFGTSESGKSTMLLSLLSYGKKCGEITARLGNNPILPPAHPDSVKYHSEATAFFADEVTKFRGGDLTHLTQRTDPLFIPVDIQPKKEARTLRFAFLEGDGEWYTKQPVTDRTRYQVVPDLKTPISQILNSYSRGISVICVAPCLETNPSKSIQLSRDSLVALIPEIEGKRANVSLADNWLLTLSMWDGLYSPGDPIGHFYGASSSIALAALADSGINGASGTGSSIWAAFTRLAGHSGNGRALMPYSAAWINNKTIMNNANHAPTFDRFNRTLWNWLYGNACQALSTSPENNLGTRKILFNDVVIPDPAPMKWHERLTRNSLFRPV